MGFVSQDVVLFQGSLYDNLSAEENLDHKVILSACKKTGLSRIMERKNIDLDFKIQEGGGNLSVGEKQLISFTRIVINSPSVLVLDEATANIDPEMEKMIQNSIELVMENRTCFIIAHRINTLEICDRILVFKNGKIDESGTYQELIDQKGYFYSLYSKGLATI